MKVSVHKCTRCNLLFESETAYKKHIATDKVLQKFNKKYPEVRDSGCKFANGSHGVPRTQKWYEEYKSDLLKILKDFFKAPLSYPAWSYGFFRCLDDSDSPFYGIACRMLHVCPVCFKEWGQSYYANNCCKKGEQDHE